MRSTKVRCDRSLIDLILSSSKDEVAGTEVPGNTTLRLWGHLGMGPRFRGGDTGV